MIPLILIFVVFAIFCIFILSEHARISGKTIVIGAIPTIIALFIYLSSFGYDFSNEKYYIKENPLGLITYRGTEGLTAFSLPAPKKVLTGSGIEETKVATSTIDNTGNDKFRKKSPEGTVLNTFKQYLLSTALLEETFKALMALITLFIFTILGIGKWNMRTYLLALLISSFAFFFIENIAYALGQAVSGGGYVRAFATMVMRTVNPVHFLLFAMLASHFVINERISKRKFVEIYLIAIFIHAVFNTYVTFVTGLPLICVMFPFYFFGFLYLISSTISLAKTSGFEYTINKEYWLYISAIVLTGVSLIII